MKGTFIIKDSSTIKYSEKAHKLLQTLEKNGGQWSIIQIPRNQNEEADTLTKLAAENGHLFQSLKLKEELAHPTTEETKSFSIYEIVEWMRPIVDYLDSEKLPEDKDQARKI